MVIEPSGKNGAPLTSIIIVADKNKCPENYEPITRAADDGSCEADVWKDGWLSFSRVYRYLAVSRAPQPSSPTVISDVTIIANEDTCPPGFTPIKVTHDSKEKALRHKQLAVRYSARDTAVDAVCDLVVLAKQKRPPVGYTLAGEIDGLTICFKYGVIPSNFAAGSQRRSAERDASGAGGVHYPGLPYPLHPNQPTAAGVISPMEVTMTRQLTVTDAESVPGQGQGATLYNGYYDTLNRQCSEGTGVEGVPFKPHPILASLLQNQSAGGGDTNDFPLLRDDVIRRLDTDFSYDFRTESQILENMLTSAQY